MQKINRIVSAIVLVCFLFNTAVQDLAFSQDFNYKPNVDKLAPPLTLGQDMGRIKFILDMYLQNSIIDADGTVNIERLKKNINAFRDSQRQAPVEAIDHSMLQIFANEATKLSNYWRIMFCIKDDRHGPRTYHAFFPARKDKNIHLPIYLYTDKEYRSFEADLKANRRLPKGQIEEPAKAGALARNVGHQAYDENLLAWVHREKKDSIYEVSPSDYQAMVNDILYMADINVTSGKEMLFNKKLYLVARDDEIDRRLKKYQLTIVDAQGKEHKVIGYMHTSNDAVHMFVPRAYLENIKSSKGGLFSSSIVSYIISRRLAYEIGTMLRDCLPIEFINAPLGIMYSDDFVLYRPEIQNNEVESGYQYPVNDIYERYSRRKKSHSAPLKVKSYTAVDLDTNFETRDVAGGQIRLRKTSPEDERPSGRSGRLANPRLRSAGAAAPAKTGDSAQIAGKTATEIFLNLKNNGRWYQIGVARDTLKRTPKILAEFDNLLVQNIDLVRKNWDGKPEQLKQIEALLAEKISQRGKSAPAKAVKPSADVDGKALAKYAKVQLSDILPEKLAEKLIWPDPTGEAMGALNIATVGDLMRWPGKTLLNVYYFYGKKIYPFNEKDLQEIKSALKKLGLVLPKRDSLLLRPLTAIGVSEKDSETLATLSFGSYSLQDVGIGDIHGVADLTCLTEEDFEEKSGFGPKRIANIRKLLNAKGFDFANPPAPVLMIQGHGVWKVGEGENCFWITNYGAAVTQLVVGGKPVIWQKEDGKMIQQEGSRLAVPGGIPLMLPVNGTTFEGKMRTQDGAREIDVMKSVLTRPSGDGTGMQHGFTDKVAWHVRERSASSITLSIKSSEVPVDVKGAKTLADIIGDVLLKQTYRMQKGNLTSALTITNQSNDRIVLGGGYHPWYQVDNPEDWTIQVPARSCWSGTAPQDVAGTPQDFNKPQPLIHDQEVLIFFTALEPDTNGNVSILLRNKKTRETRRTVFNKKDFPYVALWIPSKDKAPEPGIFSIEPVFTPSNGRNMFLSGNKGVKPLILNAGETRTINWELQVTPSSASAAPAKAAKTRKVPAKPLDAGKDREIKPEDLLEVFEMGAADRQTAMLNRAIRGEGAIRGRHAGKSPADALMKVIAGTKLALEPFTVDIYRKTFARKMKTTVSDSTARNDLYGEGVSGMKSLLNIGLLEKVSSRTKSQGALYQLTWNGRRLTDETPEVAEKVIRILSANGLKENYDIAHVINWVKSHPAYVLYETLGIVETRKPAAPVFKCKLPVEKFEIEVYKKYTDGKDELCFTISWRGLEYSVSGDNVTHTLLYSWEYRYDVGSFGEPPLKITIDSANSEILIRPPDAAGLSVTHPNGTAKTFEVRRVFRQPVVPAPAAAPQALERMLGVLSVLRQRKAFGSPSLEFTFAQFRKMFPDTAKGRSAMRRLDRNLNMLKDWITAVLPDDLKFSKEEKALLSAVLDHIRKEERAWISQSGTRPDMFNNLISTITILLYDYYPSGGISADLIDRVRTGNAKGNYEAQKRTAKEKKLYAALANKLKRINRHFKSASAAPRRVNETKVNGIALARYAKVKLSDILPKALAKKLYMPDPISEVVKPLGIVTVGDLMCRTREELLDIRYYKLGEEHPFEEKDLRIIEEALLKKTGFTLPKKGSLLLQPLKAIGVDEQEAKRLATLSRREALPLQEPGFEDIRIVAHLTRLTEEEFMKKSGFSEKATARIKYLLMKKGFYFAEPAKAAEVRVVRGKPRNVAGIRLMPLDDLLAALERDENLGTTREAELKHPARAPAAPKARTHAGKSPEDHFLLIALYLNKPDDIITAPKLADLYIEHWQDLGFEEPAKDDKGVVKRESVLRTAERDLYELVNSLLNRRSVGEIGRGENNVRQFVVAVPRSKLEEVNREWKEEEQVMLVLALSDLIEKNIQVKQVSSRLFGEESVQDAFKAVDVRYPELNIAVPQDLHAVFIRLRYRSILQYYKTPGVAEGHWLLDAEGEGVNRILELRQKFQAARAQSITAKDLEIMTRVLQGDVIGMISKAGSGHPGGSLSMLSMITALYFGQGNDGQPVMRYDPKDPNWADRDRFVLSKGHAAPGLYAALGRAGFFPAEEFASLRKLGSILQGHTDMTKTPGVDMSAGSLGVGISAAVGMALAAKMDGKNYTTYVMLGDGETQEGQVDEAARWAAAMKIDNIIAFLDYNGMQIDGKVTQTDLDYDGQVNIWKARGWNVIKADGEDVGSMVRHIQAARGAHNGRPSIIIATTKKGAGLPGMDKHGAAPKPDEAKQALDIIGKEVALLAGEGFNADEFAASIREKVAARAAKKTAAEQKAPAAVPLNDKSSAMIAAIEKGYAPDKKVSTRTANGDELVLLGRDDPEVVAFSADLKGSVMFDKFAEAFGTYSAENTTGRYVPSGIREMHMTSKAAGVAACGKIPVIGTFSIFTTRIVDQVNAILNTKLPLIIVGTHGGLATGPDGRTHQDAHSLGVLGALPNVRTYEGADAEEERVLLRHIYDTAKKEGGIHYIRPARLDTQIISKPAGWQEGAKKGFYLLFDSEAGKGAGAATYDVAIVSSGVTAVDAVAAAKELAGQGKRVKVINVTQLKSITDERNTKAFAGMIRDANHIISVIDAVPGILGDRISSILTHEKIHPAGVKELGINKYGESGTPAELYKLHGFDQAGIVKAAKSCSRLYQIAQHSTLSYDPADYKDLLPDRIQWALNNGFTELTVNPNNLSSYISYIVEHINEYPEFAKEVNRLLTEEGLRGVEFEHALISYVIKGFMAYFNRVSYEVDADIELARFQDDWTKKSDAERAALEEEMVQKTVAEIKRIWDIDREKMLVKVPNTPIGHRAVAAIKSENPATKVNFTLFFSLEDSIRGLEHLGKEDVLSQFVSRIDALTQNKANNIPLTYSQGLVGLIIAKQFFNYCVEHKINTRVILASLGAKTKIPGWMYVYCLTGGKQIMTMPYAQAESIEISTNVPEIRDNLSVSMEDFLAPFISNPECIAAARAAGFWGDYGKSGTMTETEAREMAAKAVKEWDDLDANIKQTIFATLAKEGFKKFYDPFAKARTDIQALQERMLAETQAAAPGVREGGAPTGGGMEAGDLARWVENDNPTASAIVERFIGEGIWELIDVARKALEANPKKLDELDSLFAENIDIIREDLTDRNPRKLRKIEALLTEKIEEYQVMEVLALSDLIERTEQSTYGSFGLNERSLREAFKTVSAKYPGLKIAVPQDLAGVLRRIHGGLILGWHCYPLSGGLNEAASRWALDEESAKRLSELRRKLQAKVAPLTQAARAEEMISSPAEIFPKAIQSIIFNFRVNRLLRRISRDKEEQIEIAKQLKDLFDLLERFEGIYQYAPESSSWVRTSSFNAVSSKKLIRERIVRFLREVSTSPQVKMDIARTKLVVEQIYSQIGTEKQISELMAGSSKAREGRVVVQLDLCDLREKIHRWMAPEAIVRGFEWKSGAASYDDGRVDDGPLEFVPKIERIEDVKKEYSRKLKGMTEPDQLKYLRRVLGAGGLNDLSALANGKDPFAELAQQVIDEGQQAGQTSAPATAAPEAAPQAPATAAVEPEEGRLLKGEGMSIKDLTRLAQSDEGTPEALVAYLADTELWKQAEVIRQALINDQQKLRTFDELLTAATKGGKGTVPSIVRVLDHAAQKHYDKAISVLVNKIALIAVEEDMPSIGSALETCVQNKAWLSAVSLVQRVALVGGKDGTALIIKTFKSIAGTEEYRTDSTLMTQYCVARIASTLGSTRDENAILAIKDVFEFTVRNRIWGPCIDMSQTFAGAAGKKAAPSVKEALEIAIYEKAWLCAVSFAKTLASVGSREDASLIKRALEGVTESREWLDAAAIALSLASVADRGAALPIAKAFEGAVQDKDWTAVDGLAASFTLVAGREDIPTIRKMVTLIAKSGARIKTVRFLEAAIKKLSEGRPAAIDSELLPEATTPVSTPEKRTRDDRGKFEQKNGRSPEALWMVMLLSQKIRKHFAADGEGYVTIKQLRQGYNEVRDKYPELHLASIPEDPHNDRQTREDAMVLVKNGYLKKGSGLFRNRYYRDSYGEGYTPIISNIDKTLKYLSDKLFANFTDEIKLELEHWAKILANPDERVSPRRSVPFRERLVETEEIAFVTIICSRLAQSPVKDEYLRSGAFTIILSKDAQQFMRDKIKWFEAEAAPEAASQAPAAAAAPEAREGLDYPDASPAGGVMLPEGDSNLAIEGSMKAFGDMLLDLLKTGFLNKRAAGIRKALEEMGDAGRAKLVELDRFVAEAVARPEDVVRFREIFKGHLTDTEAINRIAKEQEDLLPTFGPRMLALIAALVEAKEWALMENLRQAAPAAAGETPAETATPVAIASAAGETPEKTEARKAGAGRLVKTIASQIVTQLSEGSGCVSLPFIEINDGKIAWLIYDRRAVHTFASTLTQLGLDASVAEGVADAFEDKVREYPYLINTDDPHSAMHFLKYLAGNLSDAEKRAASKSLSAVSSAAESNAFQALGLDIKSAAGVEEVDVERAFNRAVQYLNPDIGKARSSKQFIEALNARNICLNHFKSASAAAVPEAAPLGNIGAPASVDENLLPRKGMEEELPEEAHVATVREGISILKEIMKLAHADWLDGWLPLSIIAQAMTIAGFQHDIYSDDDKSVLVFSEKAAFGEYKDGQYEEGLLPFLPSIIKSGVKVAVVARTDRQKELVKELNEDPTIGIIEERRIKALNTPESAPVEIKGAARFYYVKVAAESDAAGLKSITIIVKKLLEAIGDVTKIVDEKIRMDMHEAGKRIAIAA